MRLSGGHHRAARGSRPRRCLTPLRNGYPTREAHGDFTLQNHETSRDRNGSSQGLTPYGDVRHSIIVVS